MNVIWILLATYTTITAAQSDTIYVPTEESEPSPPRSSECVKNIELIPRNISTNLDIKIGKDHLELTVCKDDQFNYFKVPWEDCSCTKAIGLNVKLIPSKTDDGNKFCHGYSLIDDVFAYDSNHWSCSFEIFDDKSYSVIYITGYTNTKYVYAVHKETGEITEYTSAPHDESDDTDQYLSELNECLDKQNLIPKSLPISFDITKRNSLIEILAFRENHYDFYKINWEGNSCYQRIGEHREPNDTMGGDNKLCANRPLSTHEDYGTFRCAYDIWTTVHDDEDYFVFYVKTKWRGAHAYIINTFTNEISYFDSRLESTGEEIFEIYKTNAVSTKECFEKKLQLPEHLPIELEMLQKAATTVILISYANKTDYYEINRSGSVRTFKQRLGDVAIREMDELSDWVNVDEEFECPLVHLVDDRDYTILIVESPTQLDYDTQISEGYTYLINKETLDVSFKLHPNTTYSQCEIDIHQSKKEVSNEFEHDIERCANQSNLLSSATNVSIARIDNHIRISVNYDGKYDFYVLNSKGYVCYAKRELTAPPINGLTEDALQECDKRRMTSCTGGVHTFKCGLEIVTPANGDYVALNILSRFCNTTTCLGSYTYLINKFTNDVHFTRYTNHAEVKGELDRTPAHEVSDSDFEECLNLRYAIPSDLPVKFNVSVVKNLNKHIDISVYDDGKYDYYELDMRGKAYYTDIRRDMNPTRSFEEHLRCDVQHPLGPCTYEYQPSFSCGYEVIKNETDVAIFVYADRLNTYEYNVDRSSGKTLLYRHLGPFNHCNLNKTLD